VLERLVLEPLSAAFVDVGVYVAVFAAVAAIVRWRHGGDLHEALARRPHLGPAIGALLGVSPGCGGAVLVMPLYARGHVSFGTVVATLTATMGDSSWVIMAGAPGTALVVHAVLLVTGLATGYAVDALGIRPLGSPAPRKAGDLVAALPELPGVTSGPLSGSLSGSLSGPIPGPVRTLDPVLRSLSRPAALAVGPVAVLFWLATTAGATVSVPLSFHVFEASALTGGHDIDPSHLIGVVGGIVCLSLYVASGFRMADDRDGAGEWAPSLSSGLRHAAQETSFVVVWVAVAYSALSLFEQVSGLGVEDLPLHGLAGVAAGALIGLVPGCGMQIAFTGAFLGGAASLPALLANAVAQDGDALLPLIALDRRAAVTASLLTTVPALAVGSLALLVV
jgi:hypothetical protein